MSARVPDPVRLAVSAGDLDAVARWLAERPDTEDAARFEASLLLAEAGAIEPARAIADTITEPALADRAREIFAPLGAAPSALEEDEEPVEAPRPRDAEAGALAASFLEWFGGRRDLYAQQWFDEARGRGGYRPVRAPLTVDVARAHLEGRVTIGQYLLYPDDSVGYAVLDLDLLPNAFAAFRSTRGEGARVVEHPALRGYLERLLEVAGRLGLPLFPEESGRRGAHLWLFLRPRRSAKAARAVLAQLVTGAGAQPPEIGVELFPKQERNGPLGLSSLVKLPLGVHAETSRRAHLLDDRLAPIEDPRAALARLRAADDDRIDAIVGRRLALLPAPELESASAPPELPTAPTPATLAEALRAIAPGRPERTAAETVLERCGALRALVRRGYDERHLAPDEARAIAYTLGLLGPAPSTARDAFAAARASFKELDRLQRGLPSPMGCARIRGIAGPACDGCLREGSPYPTPVLHAIGDQPARAPAHVAFAAALDGPLAHDPLEAIGATLRRIEERLAQLEGRGP